MKLMKKEKVSKVIHFYTSVKGTFTVLQFVAVVWILI